MIQIPEKKILVAAAGMAAEASQATWQRLWGGKAALGFASPRGLQAARERRHRSEPRDHRRSEASAAARGAIAFAARLFCEWMHAADPQQSFRAPAGHKDTHPSNGEQEVSQVNHGLAGNSLLGQPDHLSLLRDFFLNKFPFGYYKAEIRSRTMKKN